MHKYITLIVALFCLLIPCFSIVQACAVNQNDELYTLLEKNDYAAAEQLARDRLARDKNSQKAMSNLAMVYTRASASDAMIFDKKALGLNEDETGSVKIENREMLRRAFKPTVKIDWERGKKAEAVYLDILRKWPRSKDDHRCLLDLYFYAYKHDKYIKTLSTYAANFTPEDDAAKKLFVQELLSYPAKHIKVYKNYHLASKTYEALINIIPEAPEMLSSYGATLMKLNQSLKSYSLFEKAHNLNPADPLILHNLISSSMLIGYPDKIPFYGKKLLTLKPAKSSVMLDMAFAGLASGTDEFSKGLNAYLKYIKKYPDHEYWHKNAALIKSLIDKGEFDKNAEGLASQLVQANSLNYGVAVMRHLQEKNPDNAVLHYLIAGMYDNAGYADLAYREISKSAKSLAKIKGDAPFKKNQFYFNYARISLALDKYAEAIKHLKWVEDKDSKFTNLQYMFGLTYIKQNNTVQAKKYYKLCVNSNNNEPPLQKWCRKNLAKIK